MKVGSDGMRSEMTYPGKIKKIGNAYYIGILKEYVDMLGAEDGTEVDVHVKLVNPPRRSRRMQRMNARTSRTGQGWG